MGVDTEEYRRVTSYFNLTLGGCGVIFNLVTIGTMLSRHVSKISSAVFLSALGVVDIFIILFEIDDDIAYHTNDENGEDLLFGGNEWRCRFGTYGNEACRVVSSWLVVAIAVEMFMVKRRPETYNLVYTRSRAFGVVLNIVLVSIAGTLPFLVINSANGTTCTSKYDLFITFFSKVILHPIVGLILPCLVMIYCVVHVLIKYLRSDKDIPIESQISGSHSDNKMLEEIFQKGAQMKSGTIGISLLFVITMFPFAIISIPFTLNEEAIGTNETAEKGGWIAAKYVAESIMLLNYCIKLPVVVLLDRDLRRGMLQVFGVTSRAHDTMRYGGGYLNPGKNAHLVAGRYNAPEHYEDNQFILYQPFHM